MAAPLGSLRNVGILFLLTALMLSTAIITEAQDANLAPDAPPAADGEQQHFSEKARGAFDRLKNFENLADGAKLQEQLLKFQQLPKSRLAAALKEKIKARKAMQEEL